MVDAATLALVLGLVGAVVVMAVLAKLPAPPPLEPGDDRPDPFRVAQGVGVLCGMLCTMAISVGLLVRLSSAPNREWTWSDSAWLVVLPSLPFVGKLIGGGAWHVVRRLRRNA